MTNCLYISDSVSVFLVSCKQNETTVFLTAKVKLE